MGWDARPATLFSPTPIRTHKHASTPPQGMSINLAGHNVKLQLTYLDMQNGESLPMDAGGQAVLPAASGMA